MLSKPSMSTKRDWTSDRERNLHSTCTVDNILYEFVEDAQLNDMLEIHVPEATEIAYTKNT